MVEDRPNPWEDDTDKIWDYWEGRTLSREEMNAEIAAKPIEIKHIDKMIVGLSNHYNDRNGDLIYYNPN